MKFSKILVIFVIFCGFQKLCNAILKNTNLTRDSIALSKMINIFNEEYSIELNILIFGNLINSSYFHILARKVIKQINCPIEMRVTNDYKTIFKKPLKSWLIMSDQYLFPTPLNLDEFVPALFKQTAAYRRLVIVYFGKKSKTLENTKTNGHVEHVYLSSKFHVAEVYFDKNFASLIYQPVFSSDFYECADDNKWINKYKISKTSWSSNNFLQTHNKFGGCRILVFTANSRAWDKSIPIFNRLKILSSTKTMSSNRIDIKLSGGLGDILNLYADKSSIKLKILIADVISDILIPEMVRLDVPQQGYMTSPIFYFKFTFLVTKGLPYSPFEKLALPFDYPTWIAIILSFAIGFFTIFIVYQCPLSTQKFIFGRDNMSPSLCLLQIFYGIGLVQTPGRNFARYLFMMFTIFCLIIRTAYQGVMFEIMTTDVRKPSIQTYQDILDKNITVKIITREDGYNMYVLFKKFSKFSYSNLRVDFLKF